MNRSEAIAKSPDEAIEIALKELNTTIDKVTIEITEEPSKGLFGFLKSSDYRVVATKKMSRADKACDFLSELLTKMNIDATLDAKETSEEIKIDISGEKMGIVIGRRGQTLDAIQYLVSLAVNRDNDDYLRVILDTENYRQKREKSLIKLANKMAYKAKKYRKNVVLEPMNPYERRIIHASLQDDEEITTRSEGKEPYRKVVISAKR